jgi:dTDP-4-amino-4,6-dideoxygalactose transaminase
MNIKFNKPYLTGREVHLMYQAVSEGHLSGNGRFTKDCQAWFNQNLGLKKSFLTTSCTDALEMTGILMNVGPGDEIILPSYTFVSTANAFALRGAKLVFADSRADHPGMDESLLESLISPRTKAIIPVHYAGVAADMDVISAIALKNNVLIVEDAAHAIQSFYKNKPLGSIGHMATFSFHETKNIISGEGGLLAVNDDAFVRRAEIIWEKGTDRAAFFRGEVDKYGWVDLGSSFLPSEIIAAFLYAQLEQIQTIQEKRIQIWNQYNYGLQGLGEFGVRLPFIPEFASNNAHMFYLVCPSVEVRDGLLAYLKERGIHAVFHYQSLHASKFYADKHDGRPLPQSDMYSNCLIRLPFYFELEPGDIDSIIDNVLAFFKQIHTSAHS